MHTQSISHKKFKNQGKDLFVNFVEVAPLFSVIFLWLKENEEITIVDYHAPLCIVFLKWPDALHFFLSL